MPKLSGLLLAQNGDATWVSGGSGLGGGGCGSALFPAGAKASSRPPDGWDAAGSTSWSPGASLSWTAATASWTEAIAFWGDPASRSARIAGGAARCAPARHTPTAGAHTTKTKPVLRNRCIAFHGNLAQSRPLIINSRRVPRFRLAATGGWLLPCIHIRCAATLRRPAVCPRGETSEILYATGAGLSTISGTARSVTVE